MPIETFLVASVTPAVTAGINLQVDSFDFRTASVLEEKISGLFEYGLAYENRLAAPFLFLCSDMFVPEAT